MLDRLVDGTIHSGAEEALFEEFGGGRKVTRVLFVTEVAGLLRGVLGREGSGVDLGGEWPIGVAVNSRRDCWTGSTSLLDDNAWW